MSIKNGTAVLSFTGASADEGNRYAVDLKNSLLDITDIGVEQHRERDDSQDFGATLILVLGTAAVNSLARGIATWLSRNSGARLSIKTTNGDLLAEGLDSKDVAAIVSALSAVR